MGLSAFVIAVVAAASITAYDPSYPDWRRAAQAPFAVAAVFAFVWAATRIVRRRQWIGWSALAALCVALFGIVAFA